mmetsp:Transcript_50981/g.143505  ORF Transcript_50981/g.143505 Transcript_50981/m.143505 type:complete len:248 (-) Transcript_50981:13-756(-)
MRRRLLESRRRGCPCAGASTDQWHPGNWRRQKHPRPSASETSRRLFRERPGATGRKNRITTTSRAKLQWRHPWRGSRCKRRRKRCGRAIPFHLPVMERRLPCLRAARTPLIQRRQVPGAMARCLEPQTQVGKCSPATVLPMFFPSPASPSHLSTHPDDADAGERTKLARLCSEGTSKPETSFFPWAWSVLTPRAPALVHLIVCQTFNACDAEADTLNCRPGGSANELLRVAVKCHRSPCRGIGIRVV